MIAFPALLVLISTPAWLFCAAAFADPSPLVQGSANPLLVAEHPTISLDRELLVFEPLMGLVRVTAELQFRNHGDACVVPMQFPILTWATDSGWDHVTGLTVEVDGEALEAVEIPHRNIILQGKKHYAKTYAFSVPFEAGAPLHMKVRYYQTGYGLVQVPYVLATGGTWRGPIRDFRLEVRLGERLNFHDLRLTGDDQPLPYEERDGTLAWRCTDYDGDPGLLWFHAGRGPAHVAIDGTRYPRRSEHDYRLDPTGEAVIPYYPRGFVWHEGTLLAEHSLLSQITMSHVRKSAEGGAVEATREVHTISLPACNLPTRHTPDGEPPDRVAFVEPQLALEAFGGKIRHGFTEAGDLWVSVRSAPLSAEAAARNALRPEELYRYRLRCLRRLAERWPDAFREVAREICGRTEENVYVLLAVVGHLADDLPDFASPSAIVPRLRITHLDPLVRELMYLVKNLRDDAVARGTGVVLAAADPAGAREFILEIAANRRLQPRTDRRTVGLILREVKDQDTCQGLTDIVTTYAHGSRPGFAVDLLSYLGEDEAIPFLSGLAGGDGWRAYRYGGGQVTTALARIGSARALVACVDALTTEGEYYYAHRLIIEGLAAAVGAPRGASSTHPTMLPDWASPLSPEEARQVLAPLADQIQAHAHEDLKDSVTALIEHLGHEVQPPRTASTTSN